MKKYFCDLCGEELRSEFESSFSTDSTIPHLVIGLQVNLVPAGKVIAADALHVCRSCAFRAMRYYVEENTKKEETCPK